MKINAEFIKANGLEDKFTEENGQFRPTRATLDQLTKIIVKMRTDANALAEIMETEMDSILIDTLGTRVTEFETSSSVYGNGTGVRFRLKATSRIKKNQSITNFTFAEADTEGLAKRIDEITAKTPLLKVFLTPSSLNYREDLYNAIALSVAIQNLNAEMSRANDLSDDILEAIAETENLHRIKRNPKIEEDSMALPKKTAS